MCKESQGDNGLSYWCIVLYFYWVLFTVLLLVVLCLEMIKFGTYEKGTMFRSREISKVLAGEIVSD